MGEGAAYGSAVADLAVPDQLRGGVEQRLPIPDQCRVLGAVFACHRADGDDAGFLTHIVEACYAAQVDQHLGTGNAHGEHRHQALAAGKDLGIDAVVLEATEQSHGIGQARYVPAMAELRGYLANQANA